MVNKMSRDSFRIFISSTWKDLVDERKQVMKAIHFLESPHVAMEYFSADPREPIEVCLEKVRSSNIYVGIIAHRYGTIVEETGMSYTQMEYEEAMRIGIPCLIYLRDPSFRVLPEDIEDNHESIEKLREFKSELLKRHTPSYFSDSHDLALKVLVSLSGQMKKEIDYETLSKIMSYATSNYLKIQKDNVSRFHYLQQRLDDLDLIKTSGWMCPVCGRILEESEIYYSFSMKHPVCVDCIVYRTNDVIENLEREHPSFISWMEGVRERAQKYIENGRLHLESN